MKVLIFDFDGVVTDSFEVVYTVCKNLLAKYGVMIESKNAYTRMYDKNWFDAAIELGFPEEKTPELLELLQQELPKKYHQVEIFAGMKNALEQLELKHKVIIVTSGLTKVIEAYMKAQGLQQVEVIGADKEVSKIKKIGKIKQKYTNAELYYIGDTKGDVLEGKSAGVKTVAVTWGYHKKETLETSKPDFIVDTPEELLKLFQE